MTVTVASFKASYPAFSDDARFPPDDVANIIDLATFFLQSRRWDMMGQSASGKTGRDIGVELFTAHWCSVERRNQDEGANGSPPGSIVGPRSGNSVGPASTQYDTGSGIDLDAGHWNLSNYGTRFIRMARMVGAAGIQVGIGAAPTLSGAFGAWAGPPCWVPAWFAQ